MSMNALQPNNETTRGRGRGIARALLAVVIIASQCLIWWPRSQWGMAPVGTSPRSLIVTIHESEQYGAAMVSFDDSSPISVEQASEQLAQRISGDGMESIELRVSGRASQRQLELLRRAILNASEDRPVPVRFTLIDEFDVSDV